jgi:putative transposase
LAEGEGYYHCMSRIVGGERWLGEREKGVLGEMLWQVAAFGGLRILTYAVMSNHFHVLVRVRPEGRLDDGELARRYAVLYAHDRSPWQPTPQVLAELLRENGAEGRRWRERLQARMGNLAAFMKTVKQRFSVWYNHTHGRHGTLWANRYKSVLVEGSPRALLTVAAYIDLNAVRAGQVEDPADYRWCGYAEAMGGRARAREGLALVGEAGAEGQGRDWETLVARYRRFLYGRGSGGALEKGKIPRERVLKVIREGGTVARAEALRCRVRYFTEGAVLGSEAFVQAWARRPRGSPSGPRTRSAKAHPLEGARWEGLTVLRGLRARLFT